MKWIITGGAGFIGCHAAARFHRAGHHVVVVDKLSRRGADVNLAWLRELSWQPRASVDDGLDRFIAWVKDNRSLFDR
jgi:nucleoside-diphosphate-sugar epimerase